MSDEKAQACAFCETPCSDDDFCYGCRTYVCSDCDVTYGSLSGGHEPDDHTREPEDFE